MSSQDLYKALGVEKSADAAAIKSAYRKLVLKCHPDKVQDPALKAIKQDEFQRVQAAYETLVDETKRKEYDLDIKARKMREEAVRNMSRQPSTPRASPKDYAGFNIRTAEPPPSFKPGPPPSPYSPYAGSSPHSWDRDMPYRTKGMYDDGHRARRTASYEKSRDTPKEERRRQKEDEEETAREWAREKEREREKERDKKARSDREKDEKRERLKRENEKRERERDRDRLRRQDQQEKSRSRKGAYVEPYDESDEEHRGYSKKKPSSSATASSKKHAASPRRDRERSARRDPSPRIEVIPDPVPSRNIQDKMKAAADYMGNARKRGSKSNMATPHFADNVPYNPLFPDPEQAWHSTSSPRSRRGSQEEKKYRSRPEEVDDEVERFMATPERRPPRLSKSYTSPVGTMHVPNSSAPRAPLSRAATMDYARSMPPQVPSVPPELARGKSDRRRRPSFEVEEERPRRSGAPRVVHHYPVDESSPVPRTGKSNYYRHEDDYFMPPSRTKTMPASYGGQIYQTKRYSDEDIVYSTVNHSADHYSSHTPYVGAYE